MTVFTILLHILYNRTSKLLCLFHGSIRIKGLRKSLSNVFSQWLFLLEHITSSASHDLQLVSIVPQFTTTCTQWAKSWLYWVVHNTGETSSYSLKWQEWEVSEVHTWWYLANSSWMPAIPLVAVRTLHKHGALTEAFSKYFTTDVV